MMQFCVLSAVVSLCCWIAVSPFWPAVSFMVCCTLLPPLVWCLYPHFLSHLIFELYSSKNGVISDIDSKSDFDLRKVEHSKQRGIGFSQRI